MNFDFSKHTPESLNESIRNTMCDHIGIRFTSTGTDYIEAEMPVEARTRQPYGLLHGGASVALAETMGSVGSMLTVDAKTKACVGIEINANHLRSARDGKVIGRASPIHIGRTTQVWEIKIRNERSELVCVSRLTVAVIDRKA